MSRMIPLYLRQHNTTTRTAACSIDPLHPRLAARTMGCRVVGTSAFRRMSSAACTDHASLAGMPTSLHTPRTQQHQGSKPLGVA